MTLKLTACGLDLGNGWIKIVLDGKASKIPNWRTTKEPKGALNVTAKDIAIIKPKAFPIKINEKVLWFGQDTLSLSGKHYIDNYKLKPDYIKMMFKASLYRWLSQHSVNSDWLADKRINVVCGMPPELHLNRQIKTKTSKVYKYVFDQNKPDYINIPGKSAIPFYTSFGGVKPETTAWALVNELKSGFTLLDDLGYGTSDFVLLKKGHKGPVKVKSLKNGLFHSYGENNPYTPWETELNIMRGDKDVLDNVSDSYSSTVMDKILYISRQVPLTQLVIFGGGAKLLDQETAIDVKGEAEIVSMGRGYDEFSNARWFEVISRKNLDNG